MTTFVRAIAGPAGAPLVVTCHGAGCDRAMWDDQRAVFADRFRVLAVDLPGHGAAGPISPDFSIRGVAHELANTIDRLAAGSAILVGHSLGSAVVQEVAFIRPDLTRALALVGASSTTWNGAIADLAALTATYSLFPLLPSVAAYELLAQTSSVQPAVRAYLRQSAAMGWCGRSPRSPARSTRSRTTAFRSRRCSAAARSTALRISGTRCRSGPLASHTRPTR
jgi:pimeloyl-ACP methyl ester carboxylesterase